VTEQIPWVLVVEDEAHLARGLRLNLDLEGYRVDVAASAREAREVLSSQGQVDLIILDVMLPDVDGFELCRNLRAAGDYTPVVMLTAKSDPEDRVAGLEAGADDYLVKPFELDELLARVRSSLRRRDWERALQDDPGPEILEFGQVRVDFASHEVTVAGTSIRMTRLELELLRFFAANPGRVLSRNELLAQVWKLQNYPNTRTVDNFIVRLRRYFEPDPQRPIYFRSVRGAGYQFHPSPSVEE